MSALNKAFEWITKIAYLNLLWLGFTILGLIVFGLFPATAATFTVARKWMTGYPDVAIFKTFWKAFNQSLLQSNLLGYLMVGIAYILYLDFLFITLVQNDYIMLFTIPFIFISILFALTALYIFPVYVYFEMKFFQIIKSAFFIMILNPMPTLIMCLGSFGIIFILWQFQGLALFFSLSLLAVALMMPAIKAFDKVQKKKLYNKNQTLSDF
ncbi:YesL family protein [Gracilibacillus kekensis]|uniref:Uncharacterized membrane protein YesL n=1 Tax=Gracilibacillus kekensis TaxID=1027249 RepID=A0A1M7MSS3_9BACI|nr:DUF624 domain-containing protein [Gracilibacillus kekensis]SHM94136.1 Uncharacterized membrane protein YesL [Gracilibacillus kekensis]